MRKSLWLRTGICVLLYLAANPVFAQKKEAVIVGKVVDDNDRPLGGVTVTILGRQTGIATNDSGTFRLSVAPERSLALVFTREGFRGEQRNFYLSPGEEEVITVRLLSSGKTLQEIIVTDQRDRREAGLVRVNPKYATILPSATGNVEGLIKILVGSNNELTSQYAVRGGNYDENLIYINDFEIFRPYLTRNGQQEGLSFINPELTGRINFYNGGFPSRYGDKMSSVLDVQYKKPKRSGGSVYLSLLEQGFHLEGSSKNERFGYLFGVRRRSNENLLSSQETKGSYIPSSNDAQLLLNYRLSPRWQLELLGTASRTRFGLLPREAQLTSSVFSPLFSLNLGLDIYFEGREEDRYATNLIGLSATNQVNKKLTLKWMASRFENDEEEAYDILGAYLFGERNFDRTKPEFGLITNPLGAGLFQNYARNYLNITNWNLGHKGSYSTGIHYFVWGLNVEKTRISDRLNEWEAKDSAGYNLPYDPTSLTLSRVAKSRTSLDVNRLSGYIQDNIAFKGIAGFTLQAGLRWNYNSLNDEVLISPRVQASWLPSGKRDIVLKLAAGAYHQPPFYRELRDFDGKVNTTVRAQRSYQFVAGMDYNFKGYGNRPFRFTAEAYYKQLSNVNIYDIDNVRIRYYANNKATAYATGLEMRLYGELVKDAESWVSIGLMRTRENIEGDVFYKYFNAAGEEIGPSTTDQRPADSTAQPIGSLRRPTDRLLTVGVFFQDYLSTNKNFKVQLNMIYGTNMPYNIPGSVRYRNAIEMPPYFRIDLGFSALLLDKAKLRSHSPFRRFDDIWASLEVFNLIDRDNVISYYLIKDFSNTTYAIPIRLTPRLLNFKILAHF